MIQQRFWVHIAFSVLLFIIIVAFNSLNNDAVISQLFVAAGYTYGPLLGLFTFGIATTREVKKQWVVLVCIASPVISYLLNAYSDVLLAGFEFGFLIIALNGFLTFSGLWLISSRAEAKAI